MVTHMCSLPGPNTSFWLPNSHEDHILMWYPKHTSCNKDTNHERSPGLWTSELPKICSAQVEHWRIEQDHLFARWSILSHHSYSSWLLLTIFLIGQIQLLSYSSLISLKGNLQGFCLSYYCLQGHTNSAQEREVTSEVLRSAMAMRVINGQLYWGGGWSPVSYPVGKMQCWRLNPGTNLCNRDMGSPHDLQSQPKFCWFSV